jgi:hypothetical protein
MVAIKPVLGLVLSLLLFFSVSLESVERHDHGDFNTDSNCLACRLWGAPAETPPITAALATVVLIETPAKVLEAPESHPATDLRPIPQMRAPPTS